MKVTSLNELPRAIAPPTDLWPTIAAQIESAGRHRPLPSRWPWALAAGVAALALGVLLGRVTMSVNSEQMARGAEVARSAFLDANFVTERQQLRLSATEQIRALPAAEREKLLQSVTTLQKAVEQIQSALGRDPGNALLQELLVNACQDEMSHLSDINSAVRQSEPKSEISL